MNNYKESLAAPWNLHFKTRTTRYRISGPNTKRRRILIFMAVSTCFMFTVYTKYDTNFVGNGFVFGFSLFTNTDDGKYVVPNIVHFIWFSDNSTRDLTFVNYVSILSAHRIQKPDSIYFHSNRLPRGLWWDELIKEVKLTIFPLEIPTTIFGQKIGQIHHAGDIAKMEILQQYGGIYIDYDVIIVNSLNPLRKYNFAMGQEKLPKFIAGIIVGRNDLQFLRLWYESYRNNYLPLSWDYNCAIMAYKVYEKNKTLLHVEPYKLTTPDWTNREDLWSRVIDWQDLYVVHIMGHKGYPNFTPESIRDLKSTFGEVMRHVYYYK